MATPFDDITGRHSASVVGDAATTTASAKWWGASTHLDGAGDWVQFGGDISDLAFTSGQSGCIEIAVRTTRTDCVVLQSGSSGWRLEIRSGNAHYYDGSGYDFAFGAVSDGAWHVLCVEFTASGVKGYIDGAVTNSLSSWVATAAIGAGPLSVGANAVPRTGTAMDFLGDVSHLRITKAIRYGGAYTPAAPTYGSADPYWPSVVLASAMSIPPPSATVSIDTMTADTDPQGDWATRDGSAGRAVSGSIIGTLASGEGVQASFDGGSTWVTATVSGASWSAIDPTAHATSWNIIARVVSGITGLYGALAIRAVTLITGSAPLDNPYPPLIISEHANAARYMATVDLLTRPLFASQIFARALVSAFDLDSASGTQLDQIGLWVGQSRYLDVPITGAWFSFDTSGVGFDQGVWKGPYDATTGVTRLADAQYRLLLKARIAANHWDGTRRGAVEAWAVMFDGTGVSFAIQDNQDMTINILVTSDHTLDAATRALITGGYLGIKPAGVHINGYTISEG